MRKRWVRAYRLWYAFGVSRSVVFQEQFFPFDFIHISQNNCIGNWSRAVISYNYLHIMLFITHRWYLVIRALSATRSMAGRALLAGYHRHIPLRSTDFVGLLYCTCLMGNLNLSANDIYVFVSITTSDCVNENNCDVITWPRLGNKKAALLVSPNSNNQPDINWIN